MSGGNCRESENDVKMEIVKGGFAMYSDMLCCQGDLQIYQTRVFVKS